MNIIQIISEELLNVNYKYIPIDFEYGGEDLEDIGLDIYEVMDFLKKYNNIILTGGGINECLKEVEIALLALDKPYRILKEYTY
jgi:hypothetical protein